MNNDFLRFSNKELNCDDGVVKYSKDSEIKIKKKSAKNNTALKIIINEISDYNKSVNLTSESSNATPKLLGSLIFSACLFLTCCVVSAIAYLSSKFFTLPILIFCFSIFVPASFFFFFYKLNCNKKVNVSVLLIAILLGAMIFILVELVFSKNVSEALQKYHYVVAVKCLIELLSIFLISLLIIRTCKISEISTRLLIACAVASGYSFVSSLSQNFYSLLITVNVGGSSDAVGAIINLKSLVNESIVNVVKTAPIFSIFKPCMFISVAIILVKTINLDLKSTIISVFTFIFCLSTYVLTSLQTPFNVLSVVYNVFSVLLVGYLLVKTVNACIK